MGYRNRGCRCCRGPRPAPRPTTAKPRLRPGRKVTVLNVGGIKLIGRSCLVEVALKTRGEREWPTIVKLMPLPSSGSELQQAGASDPRTTDRLGL